MRLSFDISFEQLYAREGLVALDARFIAWLQERDVALHNRLVAARANPAELAAKDESQLLIDLGPQVEAFVAALFGIEKEVDALVAAHSGLSPLYACKRLFVQRRAAKQFRPQEAEAFDGPALAAQLESWFGEPMGELVFARHVMAWLDEAEAKKDALDVALQYAAWVLYSAAGQHKHRHGLLFKEPRKLDPHHLVAVETELRDGVTVLKLPKEHHRPREGFALTDHGLSLEKALDEASYCIFCHNQGKDSCSKGLKEKEGAFKKSALDITLAGCPLEEKISEMNTLKSQGVPLGALAVAAVDNPMMAGTGHRICNDCMKSCIYQKQEPVNIPLMETQTLKDVLALPYGFEIYSLLTRWNPLNLRRPLPLPDSGRAVLVAGLGPAGYTLAHHLMNDGHTVVGIDGLKIEPLPEEISGVTPFGERVPFVPIKDINALYESLDERTLAGFGGVAEYGITVRWDKNFLKIIRLLLERRAQFAMFGGVRFGSTLTVESAFDLGFDHIALCMGAGKPTVLDIPNGLARGVRAASDFLMALQLTGAAKKDSIANLQIRLPIIVVGGGLTAIDTATESLAYYPVQVEKFLTRYEALVAERGETAVRKNWTAEDAEIAGEFIAHAKAIRAERAVAAKEGRAADIAGLLDGWGGVKLVYRKRLIDAPSYRLNHEEVEKAFEEGIYFAENLEPAAVEVDTFGHAKAIVFKTSPRERGEAGGGNSPHPSPPPQAGEGDVVLPARTILIAAGTSPNTVLGREDPEHIVLDGRYFRAVDEDGKPVTPERSAKPRTAHVLMSMQGDGRAISFFGDLHPSFAGNVVKAMGSAKQGYPVVSRTLVRGVAKGEGRGVGEGLLNRMNALLRPRVHEVIRLTPNIVEVVIHAPLAVERFEPGQFYRLQNYERFALKSSEFRVQSSEKTSVPNSEPRTPNSTILAMEGLALTGAWVDCEKGLVSLIVLEMGGSSDLCAHLQPGEPVVLMGPTGSPTETPGGETVMLVGGGLGNAVLFSIGRAFRNNGSRVLYFAGYKKAIDRYKVQEIEAAADVVVWCCDEQADFVPNRLQDSVFHGNIVEAMVAYGEGSIRGAAFSIQEEKNHSSPNAECRMPIPLSEINRIIAIGSDRMMAAVASARHTVLKPYLNPKHEALGSINSPMQCMMKEICAQCLQQHVDPATGKITYVYSCFNQDQPLDVVSFPHLNERLKQNGLQEKITALWVDSCLRGLKTRPEMAG